MVFLIVPAEALSRRFRILASGTASEVPTRCPILREAKASSSDAPLLRASSNSLAPCTIEPKEATVTAFLTAAVPWVTTLPDPFPLVKRPRAAVSPMNVAAEPSPAGVFTQPKDSLNSGSISSKLGPRLFIHSEVLKYPPAFSFERSFFWSAVISSWRSFSSTGEDNFSALVSVESLPQS